MTTGQELKRHLGFPEWQQVSFTRLLGFYTPVILILYDSRRPRVPVVTFDLKKAKYINILRAPFDKQIPMTPVLSLDMFNGALSLYTIICVDVSGRFGETEFEPKKESVEIQSKKFDEWLTFKNLNSPDAISGLTKSYRDLRNKLVKPENFTAKLTDCQYNKDEDNVTFTFTTTATIPQYPKNHEFDKTNPDKDFELIPNPDKQYEVRIRILKFMEWLKGTRPDRLNGTPISWDEIKDVLDVAYIQVQCSCPADWWQGLAYNRTQLDGTIIPCNIKPKYWNAKHLHNEEGFLCKHAYGIIRSIAFFENQMTSKLNKTLKNEEMI